MTAEDLPVSVTATVHSGLDPKTVAASRAEIEQAKGVLMAVHGISADAAFDMLVTQSQHTNTKLIAVARKLLETVRK